MLAVKVEGGDSSHSDVSEVLHVEWLSIRWVNSLWLEIEQELSEILLNVIDIDCGSPNDLGVVARLLIVDL